jgi:hypothetical protein
MPASRSNSGNEQLRVVGVLSVIAVLALWASTDSYAIAHRLSEQRPDPYGAAKAHLRFAPALPLLPPAGPVAYLSDLKLEDNSGIAAYLTAQNALAPRVLVKPGASPGPEYAIGQFSRPLDYGGHAEPHGYRLERDLGNGVVLFRRK